MIFPLVFEHLVLELSVVIFPAAQVKNEVRVLVPLLRLLLLPGEPSNGAATNTLAPSPFSEATIFSLLLPRLSLEGEQEEEAEEERAERGEQENRPLGASLSHPPINVQPFSLGFRFFHLATAFDVPIVR